MSVAIEKAEINGHQYVIAPHPTTEGLRFATMIVGAAIAPLLRVFDAGLRSGKIKDSDSLNMENLLSLLDDVDLGGLGQDLAASLAALAPEDFALLFKYTRRDEQKLSDRAVFDSVFAGNYAELYKAVAEVVRVNHFLPF